MSQSVSHSFLIIDPDPALGKLMSLMLARASSYAIRLVSDTAAAWAMLETDPPLLVFIWLRDNAMNLQAPSFCQRLRAIPGLRDVPVIVYGALQPSAITEELKKAGATGYLQVPFDPLDVRTALEAALRGETCWQ